MESELHPGDLVEAIRARSVDVFMRESKIRVGDVGLVMQHIPLRSLHKGAYIVEVAFASGVFKFAPSNLRLLERNAGGEQ